MANFLEIIKFQFLVTTNDDLRIIKILFLSSEKLKHKNKELTNFKNLSRPKVSDFNVVTIL